MRLKKGSLVEVLNKSEDPARSWWCAEIVSGNGHNYYVRYDRNLLDVGSSEERVPRRAIRPRPPSEKGRLDWVPGDVVEVLNNFSWMLAKIKMFYGGEKFLVRLLSSSTELIVPSSDIRLRKCWQDNKWIILQKDSAKCHCDKTTNGLLKEEKLSEVPQPINDQFQAKKNMSVEDTSKIFAMNMKKRARTCSRPLENCTGASKRMRAIQNEGLLQGAFARNSKWEKVDVVASPQTLFGEKYMHSSLINRNTGTFETNHVAQIANADSGRCSRLMLEGTDAESISSSVGSCGVNKSPCRSTFHPLNGSGQHMESHYDFSEAPATLRKEADLTTNKALHQGIHSLELHAYRFTMAALYASGSINWEKEALLTNLRLELHISNDEHLAELKNLVPVQKIDFVTH